MHTNKTKAKLAAGGVVFGSEIMFASADAAEIVAYAGLDFVYIDMEHSGVAAARKHGVAPGVGSFAGFSPERMRHYLHSGAQFVNITTQSLLLPGVRYWQGRLHDARTGTHSP